MQKLNFTIALVTTVNLLGCTGESTPFQLTRNDAPYPTSIPTSTTQTATYSADKTTSNKRIALIIGNASYTAVPKLNNPTNDAQDLATELRSLGFEVEKRENVENNKDMRELVHNFGNKLRGGGVGLFYYSGHGIQVDGENYLIPTSASLRSEADVSYETLGMGYIQKTLDTANNGMNIIILDACRDNPFTRSIRRSTRGKPTLGLAQMDSAKGSLVAFSTAPGNTAEDGSGRNGTYTKHLLANIKQPGLDVEGLFKKVRIGVTKETGGKQIPWESTSLTGDFCFAGCEDPTVAQAKTEAGRLRQEIAQQKLEAQRLKTEAEILKQQQRESELTKAEILKQQQAEIQKLKAETEAKRIAAQEQARQQAAEQARLSAQRADEQARQEAAAATAEKVRLEILRLQSKKLDQQKQAKIQAEREAQEQQQQAIEEEKRIKEAKFKEQQLQYQQSTIEPQIDRAEKKRVNIITF